MNGVMMPSVSAGSSQREASVICTPHVIVPSGAASTSPATPSVITTASRTTRARQGNDRMGFLQPPGLEAKGPELRASGPAEVYPPQPLRRDGHAPGERLAVGGGLDRVRPRRQLGQENRSVHRGVEYLLLLGRLDHHLDIC